MYFVIFNFFNLKNKLFLIFFNLKKKNLLCFLNFLNYLNFLKYLIFVTSDERGWAMPIYEKWVCLWSYVGTPQRWGVLC